MIVVISLFAAILAFGIAAAVAQSDVPLWRMILQVLFGGGGDDE